MSATRDDDDHVACARHAKPSGDANGAVRTDGGTADGGPDAARARLAGLQRDAAEAYAAITAADEALRALARHRVTAERALRLAAARHQAASRAAAAHARGRPGPFARLATRFRTDRQWRQQRPELQSALAAAERQLSVARQALSDAKEDFAARLAARATAAATLRSLTADCAAARAEIAGADGGPHPAGTAAAGLHGRDENRWDNGGRA